jgi:hypothetical protein
MLVPAIIIPESGADLTRNNVCAELYSAIKRTNVRPVSEQKRRYPVRYRYITDDADLASLVSAASAAVGDHNTNRNSATANNTTANED